MTVNNQQYKTLYATDGVVVDFPFNLKTTDASWIRCFLQSTPLLPLDPLLPPVEVTNFVVQLNLDQELTPGGLVTFDAPVPEGTLALARVTPITQELDYTAYDAFPAESHEEGMDKLTYAQLWTAGEALNGVRYQYITDAPTGEFVTLETFHTVGSYLRWKDEHTIESVDISGEGGFATVDYVDAADAVLQAQIDINTGEISLKADVAYVDAGDAALDVRIDELSNNKIITYDPQTLALHDGTSFLNELPLATEQIIMAIRTQNNSAPENAIVQLDAGGMIPPELLPFNGLSIRGVWNPTTDGPTPPTGSQGYVYYFNADGNMTLVTGDNQTPHTVAVVAGDAMMYLEDVAPNVDGWYFVEQSSLTSLPASSVTFDNIGTIYPDSDVQAVLEWQGNPSTGFLPKAGGNVSGGIVFDNNVSLSGRALNSTVRELMRITGSDEFVVGDSALGTMYLRSGASFLWQDVAGQLLMTLAQDGALTLTNSLILPNNVPIVARNALDTLDLNICYIDTDDVVSFGAFDHQDTKIYALNSVQMNVNGVESLTATDAGIDVTGDIKPTGAIQMPNDVAITGRNTAGDADISMVAMTAADEVLLGNGTINASINALTSLYINIANTPVFYAHALGVNILGQAAASVGGFNAEHLLRKDQIDARVVHHATSAEAEDASIADGGIGLHTAPEGS